MKVIGINGSSRKDSNTTILIKYIFKELNKEEMKRMTFSMTKKLIPVVPALLVIVEKIVFIKMILMMFLTK